MSTRKAQRWLYKAQRTMGDYDAAKRGRLGKRLARRYYHRSLIGVMRRMRIW